MKYLLNLIILPATMLGWGFAASQPTSAQSIPELDSLIERDVRLQHVGGAVLQVVRDGEILHRKAYGFAQRYSFGLEPVARPDTMSIQHLFDLASLTKVLGTTFAVMMLVDEGHVELDATVGTYLPAFRGGAKDHVTIRHLLAHTGGLAQWEPLYYHGKGAEEIYRYIANAPLAYEVGRDRHYSDLGFMLLGYIVERVTGQTLDRYLRERLYEPIGLRHTVFNPLQHGFDAADIAATSHGNPFERRMVYDDTFGYVCDEEPTSWDGWRGYTLRGEVNDGNAYYAHGGMAGHAGLFSTAADIQVLLQLLLDEGWFGGRRLISTRVVREFLTPDRTGNGLGWAMDPDISQTHGAGSFGHTGFTGTYAGIIPEHALTIILLTNRQHVGPDEQGYYYDLNPTRRRAVEIALDHVAK